MINLSTEATAQQFAALADGVGTIRSENIVRLRTKERPDKLLDRGDGSRIRSTIRQSLKAILDYFHPKPVWYRTFDELNGNLEQAKRYLEPNPIMGQRGIRLELDRPELLQLEAQTLRSLLEEGYDNLGIKFPMAHDAGQLRQAKEICKQVGLVLGRDIAFGVTIEVPSAAILVDAFLEEGVRFVTIGWSDLTSFTVAVDRDNPYTDKLYNQQHPAVEKLVIDVATACRRHGVHCLLSGDFAGNKYPSHQIARCITGVSLNAPTVADIERMREYLAQFAEVQN